jgi:hypothetical protein
MLGTLSFVEAAWVIFSATAASYCVSNARAAYDDFKAVRLSGRNGGRLLISAGAVRNEAIQAFAQLMFLVPGVIAAFRPDNPTPGSKIIQIALAGFLLTAQGFLAFNSALNKRGREKINEYYEDLEG